LANGQRAIYRTLLSGLESFAGEIRLPLKPVNEISLIFDCILLDNPLIYYLSSFNHSNDLHKNTLLIKPNYKYARSFVKQNTSIINKYLRVYDAVKNKSDVDKEIFVHDYCLNNFCYDNAYHDYSYSVLGLVLNRTAVCEGIAKFVKLSLDYLDVSSLVVFGKAKNPVNDDTAERHAWNIVEIEGMTYHLDVTFDMTLKSKLNRYDYFNLSDDDIKREHTISNGVPLCSTKGNDYFSVNSLVVFNPVELDKFIEHSLMHGKKNIMVKLKNVKDTANVVDKVISIAQQQYANIYKCTAMVEVKYNPSQLVFEINYL